MSNDRRLAIAALEHTLIMPAERRPPIGTVLSFARPLLTTTTSPNDSASDLPSASSAILGFRPSERTSKILSVLADCGVFSDELLVRGDVVHYRSLAKPPTFPVWAQLHISTFLSNAVDDAISSWCAVNALLFVLAPVDYLIRGPSYSTFAAKPVYDSISETANWLGSGRITEPESQKMLVDTLDRLSFGFFALHVKSGVLYILAQDRKMPFLCQEARSDLSMIV